MEGSQETNKTNESREEINASEEKSNNEETKDPEAGISEQFEKEFTILILSDVGAEVIKEGENKGNSEEESDSEEEEEEEGEIEMTTPRKKKTKGRRSKKEVREQATYKDKL